MGDLSSSLIAIIQFLGGESMSGLSGKNYPEPGVVDHLHDC